MKFHDERILPVDFFNMVDRQKYIAVDFGQKTDNAKRIKQRTMSDNDNDNDRPSFLLEKRIQSQNTNPFHLQNGVPMW